MNTKPSHPVVCVIALAAFLLNWAAAAGGAVLCQDPHGGASIQMGGDHDHCAVVEEAHAEHEHGDCWCDHCPCEDESLAVEVVPVVRDDEVRSAVPDLSHVVCALEILTPPTRVARAVEQRPPPEAEGSLLRLRTIVLIV